MEMGAGKAKRLLALEIRSRKFGFAVFEGYGILLDWGVRWFGSNSGPLETAVSNRIRALINIHKPFLVVARKRSNYSSADKKRFATILRLTRVELRRNLIKLQILGARRVQQQFASLGRTTKYEIAMHLAGQFADLSWRLPGRKKSYQSEASTMVIFDATATGSAFFSMQKSADDVR